MGKQDLNVLYCKVKSFFEDIIKLYEHVPPGVVIKTSPLHWSKQIKVIQFA